MTALRLHQIFTGHLLSDGRTAEEHTVRWGQETLEERIRGDRRACTRGSWSVCRGQAEDSVVRAHRAGGCRNRRQVCRAGVSLSCYYCGNFTTMATSWRRNRQPEGEELRRGIDMQSHYENAVSLRLLSRAGKPFETCGCRSKA